MTKIIKASGEWVEYSEKRLRESLEQAGASQDIIKEILRNVRNNLHNGTTTKELYSRAYYLLHKYSNKSAVKYKLKKSISDLGPSGYPFEKFVARLLEYQGYNCEVSVNINGRCVSHEVDVVGTRDDKNIIVECKFHNRQGVKSDVKVPLYIHSRFRDLKFKNDYKGGTKFDAVWVITNTSFTEDAINYGNCAGLKLVSWDYPNKGNLRDWILVANIHPITCLEGLKSLELDFLTDNDVVIVKDLVNRFDLLSRIGVDRSRIRKIEKQIELLYST